MNFRLDTIFKLHSLTLDLKISPFELAKNLNEQGFAKINIKRMQKSACLWIQHWYYKGE